MSAGSSLFLKGKRWLSLWAVASLLTGCRVLLPGTTPTPHLPDDPTAWDDRDRTRPYEVVWAQREWDWPLLIDFERALDWQVETTTATKAAFDRTQTQRLWGEYAGRLAVELPEPGDVQLRLAEPVPVRDPIDTVLLWVKPSEDLPVNNESKLKWTAVWETATGEEVRVDMGPLRGAGWILYAAPLDPALSAPDAYPLHFKGIDWSFPAGSHRVYLDGLSVLHDLRKALRYPARPRRGLSLRAGQLQGVNTGRASLGFPLDAASVIPAGPNADKPLVLEEQDEGIYRMYAGDLDARNWAYDIDVRTGVGPIRLVVDDKTTEWSTTGIQWEANPLNQDALIVVRRAADHLYLEYESGTIYQLRTVGHSLVMEVAYRGRDRAGVAIAPWQPDDSSSIGTLNIPFWHEPDWAVMPVQFRQTPEHPLFVHAMLDPWYSNASEWWLSTGDQWLKHSLVAGYQPAVGEDRNDIHERVILTAAPTLEALLPRIPNPKAVHAEPLSSQLIFVPAAEDGNMDAWAAQRQALTDHGLTNLIWKTPATIFQAAHESPAYRLLPHPFQGGMQAYESFAEEQQAAGLSTALFMRPRTLSALNRFWSADAIRRAPDRSWSTAADGGFSVKPLWSLYWHLEHMATLQERFQTDTFWLDGFPESPPWHYTDYDPRVPGRATFSQVLYADGDWLRVWAEEHAAITLGRAAGAGWYAGLLDGFIVPATPVDGAPDWRPYNPLFKLQRIQPVSVVYGAAQDPAADIDVHIADWLAYGQGGVIRYDPERMDEWGRAYRVMRTVQPHIMHQAPLRIRYHCPDAGYMRPSAAIASGVWQDSRLYVEYPGEVELWVNGSWEKDWTVRVGGDDYQLPPSGWVVTGPDFFVFSGWHENGRIDYIEHPNGIFLDPRDRNVTFRGHEASGTPLIKENGP